MVQLGQGYLTVRYITVHFSNWEIYPYSVYVSKLSETNFSKTHNTYIFKTALKWLSCN